MKITNLGLSAFYGAATLKNMTQASEQLGLTQSALSQRIMKLEEDLETTLFIRDGKYIRLTEAGKKLLLYCQTQSALEEELLFNLKGSQETLAGSFNIATYSSILRSFIIPKLAPFLRSHPNVRINFSSFEMHELPSILESGKADLIIMDYKMEKSGLVTREIFEEEFVVIRSKKFTPMANTYLDNDPDDNATASFFSVQKKPETNYKRMFMGDVYGIIDGVKNGLGLAVMSKHMIENDKTIEIIKGYKEYKRPVTIHYFERPFYPKLFSKILEEIV